MKALHKDIFREIKKSFGRFFSIFAIVFIGVAFFSGVNSSSYIMKYSADKYYDEYNFMDFRLLSKDGFTIEEVEKIKNTKGVLGVHATNTIDVLTNSKSKPLTLRLHGISLENSNDNNNINKPLLKEGRYPENSGECLVEVTTMKEAPYEIGDTIRVHSGTDMDINYSLKTDTYKVVGIVNSPYYLSYEKGTTTIGDGIIDYFCIIPDEDFNFNICNEVFVTVNGAKKFNSYEKEYFNEVNKVKERLEKISDYTVLDRTYNYSYSDYESAADKIDAISKVFPVFFLLVAALVCLTTITRMLDEQRGNIGILKALGYSKVSIVSKFLIYTSVATVLGVVLGLALGMVLFPTVIYNAWRIMYSMPEVQLCFLPELCIGIGILFILITNLTAYLVCYKELFETPSLLMRPKAPKLGKKIFFERIKFIWKKLSFSKKVTVRNIFRYKKRFVMTVVGIAGCTSLLLAGFGIMDSIKTIGNTQFKELFKFNYEAASSIEITEELIDKYKTNDSIKDLTAVSKINKSISNKNLSYDIALYVISDIDKFDDFFTLRNRITGEKIDIKKEGIIISEKTSNDLKVNVGDKVKLSSSENKTIEVKVAGITENYIDNYGYLTAKLYSELFNESIINNRLLLKIKENSKTDNIVISINGEDGIVSMIPYSKILDNFNDLIVSLNYIVIVLIISAGALAFVVLYNLTNINISERIREIATIKVLGFYDKEVSSYVYRENIILTIIGTFFGCLLGIVLHRFIMVNLDLDTVMFGRNIKGISFAYSILLTLGFSLIVNFVMYFKLRKIPMVESLKSIE